ncbi:ATP-binding protein [Deinococcus hohokamensis]|uniref:histidine kinase n=1 Tax=Deinococcus hohokamensis TaxID=309883 RepID=A0ABV9I7Q1_9DEIO
MTHSTQLPFDAAREIFVGEGEMARRMLERDWASTPLGPPQQWPQSLKTIVRVMLTSRFAMWMAWGDDLTFFCNDAYRPTLGVKHTWALGARSDVVWAEIWKDIGPRIDHVMTTGEATWDEGLLLFLERSGYPEETYHTFSYSPLADDASTITGMLCVVTEESERVIGERQLRVLRDLAARLNDARTRDEVFAAVGACLNDEAHDVPAALALLGEGSELQPVFRSGWLAQGSPAADWPLAQVLEQLTPALLDPLPAPLSAGANGPSSYRALALPMAQPGAVRAAGVFVVGLNPYRPLSEAYRGFLNLFVGQVAAGLANAAEYEAGLRRAEALAALDRAKTAFFANASHELRTPLTLILGPLEDLLTGEAGELAPAQRATLDMAHRNALRLLRLVNGLLDFSRLESGRAQASYTPTDLAAFTADLASSFRDAMERAGLQYVVETDTLPDPVYLDPELWEKVVLNLLSNAFKFTLAGQVAVSVRAEGGWAVLRVSDTGVGVPPAEVSRLFERFHRVEGQRGRSFEGTGIGLALVREIVELHGGSIEAQSEEGQGTTFTVRVPFGHAHLPPERLGAPRHLASTATGALPYVEEALRWLPDTAGPETLPEPDVSSELPTTVRGRILLADDNGDLREYIQKLLVPHHDVQVVANGEAALEAVRAEAPDLVITDVMMPRLDGFGVLRALREGETTRNLPVIMLSARAGEEARVHGLEAGADDYLVKPFSARELLAKVNAHLALSRLRRQALEREQAYSAELETKVAERTKALREALDHSEWQAAELNTILASLPDAVYVGDLNGIKRANQPALDMLGFDTLAQLAQPVSETDAQLVLRNPETGEPLPPGEGPFIKAALGQANQVDVLIRHMKTGEDRVMRAAAAPIRRGEQVVGAVSVVSDITERARLQDTLRRANEELTRSNAELERFAYIASHDLQEPIRTVASFAGLVNHRYGAQLDSRGQTYLRTIEQGAERMKVLVDDILVFSRLNADPPPLRPVNLNEPLREALARLDATLRDAGAQVDVAELPLVWGDAPRLAQLFQNLVGNAVKFRRAEVMPEVRVSAAWEEGSWHVQVSDNGIGIEAAYYERIFEMFQRLHGRQDYTGTGLGLAICQKILAQHGGRIWVDSQPGMGSTFHFTLNAAEA